jgi:hypothetical protein
VYQTAAEPGHNAFTGGIMVEPNSTESRLRVVRRLQLALEILRRIEPCATGMDLPSGRSLFWGFGVGAAQCELAAALEELGEGDGTMEHVTLGDAP